MKTIFTFDGDIPKYQEVSVEHGKLIRDWEELFYKEMERTVKTKYMPDGSELLTFRKLSALVTRILTVEYPISLIKQMEKFTGSFAKRYEQNLRARLLSAPYNFRGIRPGPWSRWGGQPSAYSIRAYVKEYEIKSRTIWSKDVRLEIKPTMTPMIMFDYTKPPWQYLFYKRGGLHHIYFARVETLRQYAIKSLAAYKKHYGRKTAKITIQTR